ncbi:glycosyl hydrolase [Massilioclostridium coli]|uniref:glycosyl hydrolase n=1 Tax=Massilioclostridium coli TaxID=1870991 RepID=UPI00085BC953|nr:glycosyl hydrolase [Massilioclostridium coli]
MKHTLKTKMLAAVLSVTMVASMGIGMTQTALAGNMDSAISASEFAKPGMEYRPGVRWWISPGTTTEDLLKQIDYLAENGFGMVEISPFNAGYVSENGSSSAEETIYPDERLKDYDNDVYYEKIEAVIAAAEEKGITVDLNMGSGYDASYKTITAEDGMENMALGRTSISVQADNVNNQIQVTIPDVEVTPLYGDKKADGILMTEWTGVKKLEAIIFAKKDSNGTPLTAGNGFIDINTKEVNKTYENQVVLDINHTTVIDMSEEEFNDGDIITLTPDTEGEWEVIALYSIPSGAFPIRGIADHSYVVDHLDGEACAKFVNEWLGNEDGLKPIVSKYSDTIRAAFNDSYEFYTDKYFNYKVYDAAKSSDTNVIGYDLTKYLPSLYKQGENCFGFGVIPKTNNTFLTYNLSEDEKSRIVYDYNQLVNEQFLEGMESFSNELAKYSMVYRQQAYNPPIDTIKSSYYVDIPETEGLSEYSLRRVSSGAHLYGKNLVTSEVYTLGSTPYQCTPQFIKNGYDLMATSGVNNFFYHGLSSIYYGSEEAQANQVYGEEGWRAWPGIGIEVGQVNPIWPYFNNLNMYAARANYMMQQGNPSSDVAIYMPLFGSIQETDAVKTMNYNGYTYDAVNDDAIQNEFSYQDGKIVAATSGMTYDVLLIQDQTMPVETINALNELAKQGAPIIFYGDLPNKQPSYADGNYAALDQQVVDAATAITTNYDNVACVSTMEEYTIALDQNVTAPISCEYNTNVRLARRSLETGGELAYIRNTSKEQMTVTLDIDPSLENCYWLDQNSGEIYQAEKDGNTITVTLESEAAIGLVCELEQVGFQESELSEGIPDGINTQPVDETIPLEGFTLSVTADNIGAKQRGEVQTVTFDQDVFGDWSSDTFQNGVLKYVSNEGTYTTQLDLDENEIEQGKRFMLDLGIVYSPVTVVVNDIEIGKVEFVPYEIDVTSALKQGINTIIIKTQPLGNNRRIGFREYYNETKDPEYIYYGKYIEYIAGLGGKEEVINTGIEGPIQLNVYQADVQADKGILNSVIAYAEAAKESGEYDNAIESVQKSFDAALENAKTVAGNAAATQEEVDAAWKTLLNEIHKLGFVAGDKTELASLIEAANEINAELDRYVEAGKAEFTAALEAAKGVYNDGDAMQAEVNEAADNLLNAMLNLRYKADKSILEDVLTEAGKVDANAYTAESYAALQAAVAEAKDVYNNENATQEEVDAAVTSVQTAIDNLVAVDGTPAETPTEDNDTAGSQTGQESTTPKANAAKTGDFAPIAGMAAIAIAGAALVLSRKKK